MRLPPESANSLTNVLLVTWMIDKFKWIICGTTKDDENENITIFVNVSQNKSE